MRVADMLIAIASWLESKDNEALLLAEYDEICMEKTAEACVKASTILKDAANQIDLIEGQRKLLLGETKQLLESLAATSFGKNILNVELFDGEAQLTNLMGTASEINEKLSAVELPEDIEATVGIMAGQEGVQEIGKLANIFDMSDDQKLQKVASVIDELLLTVSADPEFIRNFKAAQKKQLDDIREKYQAIKEKLDVVIGVEDAKKAIDKSPYYEAKRPLEAPLSTRSCPDHPGALMQRVGEDTYQCSLDRKTYDFKTGFTTEHNAKVPGGSVQNQSANLRADQGHQMFDSREERQLAHQMK